MAYTHDGKKPVVLKNDPIDTDSTDWVYFIYDDWLTVGETITTHSSTIVGGTIETASTSVGPITLDGVAYQTAYAVEVKPSAGSTQISVTHRVTTTKAGAVDLGRTSIDHTAVLPVKTL